MDSGSIGWCLRPFASASLTEVLVSPLKSPERLFVVVDLVLEEPADEPWSAVTAVEASEPASDLADRFTLKTAARRRIVLQNGRTLHGQNDGGDEGQEVYDDDENKSMSMEDRQKQTGRDAQNLLRPARR